MIAFLIIDALLIAFALTRDDGSTGAVQQPAPIPTFGSASSASPSPSPTPTPEPIPEAAPRFLLTSSETAGWRSTRGGCSGDDAILERTVDGGSTWEIVNPPELHQVLGMTSPAGSTVRVVGRAGNSCAVGSFASFTGGQFWNSYPESIGDFAFVEPSNPTVVHRAEGNLLAPCEVNELHQRDDAIALGCDDQLLERAAGTEAWLSVAMPGLLAFTPSDTGYTLASVGTEQCASVAIHSLAVPIGSAAPSLMGCLPDEAEISEVTLSQFESTLWLWSSDRVFVSSDGGISWR